MTRSIGWLAAAIVLAASIPGAQAGDRSGVPDPAARPPGLASQVADSAGACPPRRQVEAGQVIRLHTELMVTSLTCADAYGDPALHDRYRRFSSARADQLRSAQNTIMRHRFGGSPRRYDTFHTELANQEMLFAMALSVPAYCAARRLRFESLVDDGSGMFDSYVEALTGLEIVRRIGC